MNRHAPPESEGVVGEGDTDNASELVYVIAPDQEELSLSRGSFPAVVIEVASMGILLMSLDP